MPSQIDKLLAEVGAKYGLSDELCPEDGIIWFDIDGIRSGQRCCDGIDEIPGRLKAAMKILGWDQWME